MLRSLYVILGGHVALHDALEQLQLATSRQHQKLSTSSIWAAAVLFGS